MTLKPPWRIEAVAERLGLGGADYEVWGPQRAKLVMPTRLPRARGFRTPSSRRASAREIDCSWRCFDGATDSRFGLPSAQSLDH